MADHNQIEVQPGLEGMAIDQPMPAEPQVMLDNPPPAENQDYGPLATWAFPDISTFFGGPSVGSSHMTTPPLPSLNENYLDNNLNQMVPTPRRYVSTEQSLYVPYEISHNPHLVIEHLTTLLVYKDKQLKSKSNELLEKSTMTRNLTVQLLETQDENIRLRRRMLNINPNAMTFLEDYPPEVNAHLSPNHPQSG